jgi:hypothetical protein
MGALTHNRATKIGAAATAMIKGVAKNTPAKIGETTAIEAILKIRAAAQTGGQNKPYFE